MLSLAVINNMTKAIVYFHLLSESSREVRAGREAKTLLIGLFPLVYSPCPLMPSRTIYPMVAPLHPGDVPSNTNINGGNAPQSCLQDNWMKRTPQLISLFPSDNS